MFSSVVYKIVVFLITLPVIDAAIENIIANLVEKNITALCVFISKECEHTHISTCVGYFYCLFSELLILVLS